MRAAAGSRVPTNAIILGSGLGGLAGKIQNAVRIPFATIPGFPEVTVIGHEGAVIAGTLGGCEVVALSGRFHMYEGHPPALAGFPVRVLHALGARELFVSNAAGGISPTLAAGDLMVIGDQINLMFTNPLTGPAQRGETRFPDMTDAYDKQLRGSLHAAAKKLGFGLKEGVYAGLRGPSYETRAEIKMLRTLSADAVGMSTVPEVIVARALGMRVAGVSCITNLAAGISPTPLSHDEVIETSARVADRFQSLVTEFLSSRGKPAGISAE
ncbi:MAG: purine-nucleoside phosphorylase [Gemmatimonadota bacterium]|nr:purine-nucleoside phosphorylase [Gemmatimonadota bacterium]